MKRRRLVSLLVPAWVVFGGCGGDPEDGRFLQCEGVTIATQSSTTSVATRVPQARVVSRDRPDPRERIIVRTKDGRRLPALDAGSAAVAHFERGRSHVVLATSEMRATLERSPDVDLVELDPPIRALKYPFTPVQQGSTGEYTPGIELVGATRTWDQDRNGAIDPAAPTGKGIKICVLDSGLDRRHPELKLPVAAGRDFVDDDDDYDDRTDDVVGLGHGTHVAGIIAAQLASAGATPPGANADGIVGVAPGASLLIARVLDVDGEGRSSNVVRALEWCRDQGANIVTASLASSNRTASEERAFTATAKANILVFAATGNGGAGKPMGYPASYAYVTPVGAVDGATLTLAPFSQTGFGPDHEGLVAPGIDILSTTIVGSGASVTITLGGEELGGATNIERALARDYAGPLVDCGAARAPGSCGPRSCRGFVALFDHDAVTDDVDISNKVRRMMNEGAGAILVANVNPDLSAVSFSLGPPRPVEGSNEPALAWPPVVAIDAKTATALRAKRASAGEGAGSRVALAYAHFDYARRSGTSEASPHAAGVAALVWSAHRELTACQVRRWLLAGAKDLGSPGLDTSFGYGLVEATKTFATPVPAVCNF